MYAEYQEQLLTKRIPREDIIFGRAYIIHARNGGVGIARQNSDQIEYTLHRVKFGNHFLFPEVDWADDDNFGTAIPLQLLEDIPSTDESEWLDWLAEMEEKYKEEVKATWPR